MIISQQKSSPRNAWARGYVRNNLDAKDLVSLFLATPYFYSWKTALLGRATAQRNPRARAPGLFRHTQSVSSQNWDVRRVRQLRLYPWLAVARAMEEFHDILARQNEAIRLARREFFFSYHKRYPSTEILDANWYDWSLYVLTLPEQERNGFLAAWEESYSGILCNYLYGEGFEERFIATIKECKLGLVFSELIHFTERNFTSSLQFTKSSDYRFVADMVVSALDEPDLTIPQKRNLDKALAWLQQKAEELDARLVLLSNQDQNGFAHKFVADVERLPWGETKQYLDQEYWSELGIDKVAELITKVKSRLSYQASESLVNVLAWLNLLHADLSDTTKSTPLYHVADDGKIVERLFTRRHARNLLAYPGTLWRQSDLPELLGDSGVVRPVEDITSTQKQSTSVPAPITGEPKRTIFTELRNAKGITAEVAQEREKRIWALLDELDLYVDGKPGPHQTAGKWVCFFWALVYNKWMNGHYEVDTALNILINSFDGAEPPGRSTLGKCTMNKISSPDQLDGRIIEYAERLKKIEY